MRTLGLHWIPFMVAFPLIKELISGVWRDCSVDKVLSVQAISSWVQIQHHHKKLGAVHAPVTPELRNRNRWIYPWGWLFSQSSQEGERLSSVRDYAAKKLGWRNGWGSYSYVKARLPHAWVSLPTPTQTPHPSTQMYRNNRHTSS